MCKRHDLPYPFEMATVISKYDEIGFIGVMYSHEHNPPHIHLRTYEGEHIGNLVIFLRNLVI